MELYTMTNHNYVFGEGGTGLRILLALYQIMSSRAYAKKGATENYKQVYETMDAGAEEIEELKKLLKADKDMKFNDPAYFLAFLKLAERVKDMLAKDKTMSLEKIAPEWFRNELLLTREELLRDLLGGYYRDLVLGSVVSAVAMRCALETEEDKKAGFQAVIDDVVASNNTYEVRVAFAGSGIGGEGRTNICARPAMLKSLCIERVMEDLKMQQEQAKAYVERNLKIAVVMVGSAFRFPAIKGLDQDVAGLVAGTLRNFPDDSAEAVNLMYLLEHDCCPVQASQPSDSGEQHKHAHAIELVAVSCIENFFHRDTESASKKQCPVFPHYSMPGRTLTNWENLGLPEEYRINLSARLRFDAALFYWVRPQLMVTPEERNAGKLYESEILARMFKAKTPKQVEESIYASGLDLDQDILKPLRALLEKETMYLKYLRDICLTGKNWETGAMPSPDCSTDLFDVSRIEHMLTKNPSISDFGGMTGFKLDELTMCPKNKITGTEEDSLYHTKLTMDKLRNRITYNKNGKPRAFREILNEIYDICSERKEKKRYGIF